jgi:dTDP-4-amino-4,6-dideoxygalactose transaminase
MTPREIFDYYHKALGDLPGIEFMPEASYGKSNRWLTVILITPEECGADRETVRLALEAENIEARSVWKPMHMRPVFNPQIASRKGACLRAAHRQAKAQNNIEKRHILAESLEEVWRRICLSGGFVCLLGRR